MDLASVDDLAQYHKIGAPHTGFRPPLEPEVIKECIALVTQASTAAAGEVWRFATVTKLVVARGPLDQSQHALGP